MSELCRTCGQEVAMQIQKNTGYCCAKHQEAHNRSDYLLQRYREIQRGEGLTIEGERQIARAQGEAWREYLAACEREGIKPESPDSPDLGHW